MSDTLDPAVVAALAQADLSARGFREISMIRGPSTPRRTYRIDLESGTTIKARRLENAATARRLFELRQGLPDAFVPPLACHGPVLFEEWIEGTPVRETSAPLDLLRTGAHLLALLHRTTTVTGQTLRGRESTALWRDQAEAGVARILAAGGLEAAESSRLRTALGRTDPGAVAVGLTHNDLCGENLVVDSARCLRVVDNDRMAVGPLGFDLARSVYRWNLEGAARECFLGAYADEAPSEALPVRLEFWELVVVVKSAVFRLWADPSCAHVPLDRLRRLATTREPR